MDKKLLTFLTIISVIGVGSAIFFDGLPLGLLIIIGVLFLILVIVNPYIGLLILIPTLFLESRTFMIEAFDVRIRIYHILTIIIIFSVVLNKFLKHLKWRRTILDIPLLIYLGVNMIAFIFTPSVTKSMETMILLALMVCIYFIIIQLITTKKQIHEVSFYFLFLGIIQGLIGWYQIVGLYLGWYSNLDMFHELRYFQYGRPWGTFIEADWFGAFVMVFLLIFFILFISDKFQKQKWWIVVGAIISMISLVLSGVRGAWIGGLGGVALFMFFLFLEKMGFDKALKGMFNSAYLFLIMTIIVISFSLVVVFDLDILDTIGVRLQSITNSYELTKEPRVMMAENAWGLIQNHPIIGNGPGSYSVLGIIPYVENVDNEAFLTNFFLTVLNDTGVVGLISIILIICLFSKKVWSFIKDVKQDQEVRIIALAYLVSIFALFISYQVTTGFWLGLTWFLLGITMAVVSKKNSIGDRD